MIPFSDDELINPVKEALSSQMHILENDGGGLELLGIKKGVVYVKLTGACHGCAASDTTLKYALERALKTQIHPELVIKNLAGGQADFAKL